MYLPAANPGHRKPQHYLLSTAIELLTIATERMKQSHGRMSTKWAPHHGGHQT